MQIRIRERARMHFLNYLLTLLWLQLFVLLRQLRLGRENRRAFWNAVCNVHYLSVCIPVFLQKRRNGFACLGCVGDLEFAFGVLVLGIDDDESTIAWSGR